MDDNWLPMDTAPMGKRVLVSCVSGTHELVDILVKGYFGWYDDDDRPIEGREVRTYLRGWMPLPEVKR